jgi:hypothetical protein
MNGIFLGDDRSEDLAVSAKWSVARISPHLVRLVVPVVMLILAQSSFAGSTLTREKAPARHAQARASKIIRFVTHYRVGVAEFESESATSLIECLAGSFVKDRQNDQSDDGTSDDPNDDDDAWDDLNAAENTEAAVFVWVPQVFRCFYAPDPGWTPLGFESPTSPSKSLQRLRC